MKKILLLFLLVYQFQLRAQPGSNDTTFNIIDKGRNNRGAGVKTFAQLPNGSIVIGGFFESYNGAYMFRIGKLKPDGTPDDFLSAVSGPTNSVTLDLVVADDIGKKIYYSYSNQQQSYIVLADDKGKPNNYFFTGDPNAPFETGLTGQVETMTPIPNAGVLIGGFLTKYNSNSIRSLEMLDSTGQIDQAFNKSGSGPAYGSVYTSKIIPNTNLNILIGGGFTEYNNKKCNYLAKLALNGERDESFNNGGTGPDSTVRKVAIQDDGKIIIIGDFKSYNGVARNKIARLNIDGTLDTSFNPGTGANGPLLSVAIQKDKKILVGGDYPFTSFNGTSVNRLVRLNTDGSLDPTFNPVMIENNNHIYNIAITQDNKILICGSSTYNGVYNKDMTRLLSDGQPDMTFNPGTGSDSDVRKIIILNDKKIVITGGFTVFNNSIRRRLARLNPDGSLDTTIDPGIGTNGSIYDCIFQNDGKLLISGYFTNYNNVARNGIARLNSD